MNAYKHSEISVKKRGGVIEDYLPIHEFIDSTKEICSDNRHRILHTMWGIKRVIIPIFGQVIKNSDGKIINVKDLCEQDHILPDYQNKFIPTLSDFVKAIKKTDNNESMFAEFADSYKNDSQLFELLISPLNNTGILNSLYITHNSWFINEIVPKILDRDVEIKNFSISPSDFFEKMEFELWMDNGNAVPNSAKMLFQKIVG